MDRTIGLYPASFDPPTNGHLDIIERVLNMRIFHELVLAIGVNPDKVSLFSVDERCALLEDIVKRVPNGGTVRVGVMHGLMVEHARHVGARVVIRGVRSPRDFEYESELSYLTRHLAPEIDMMFLLANPRYASLSSTLVKQVAHLGGDLDGLVPPAVVDALRRRIRPGQAHIDFDRS